MKILFYLVILIIIAACQPEISVIEEKQSAPSPSTQFLLGVDNFLNNKIELVKDKRVALLTNPSGVNADLIYTSDLLFNSPEVKT